MSANSMLIPLHVTARHKIRFKYLPTKDGGKYCRRKPAYTADEYASILDCVFEMADMVSTSNGIAPYKAIEQVLKDEGWLMVNIHKRMIAKSLKS